MYLVAAVFSLFALIDDMVHFRISNRIIISGLAAAGLIRIGSEGLAAIPHMLAGAFIPVIVCMPFLAFSMLGAGDIKLFMLMGMFTGYPDILWIMFMTCFATLPAIFIKKLSRDIIYDRVKYFICFITNFSSDRKVLPYIRKNEINKGEPYLIHMSVPAFAALIIILCRKMIG